jgi:N-acyl homoserine lactone hydrolase
VDRVVPELDASEEATVTGPAAKRLYLFQLSASTVPLPAGPLDMVTASYLIELADARRVLVDTGMPADRPANLPPAREEKNVLEHLAALHLAPADIDIVVATHFDIDHAGYHDAFPGAQFVVQRAHYEIARGGHPRYAAARAHWDAPALRYTPIDGDVELAPGVTLIETSGHAPGHQSVLVQLAKTGPVLLAIDAVILRRLFRADRPASPMDADEAQLRASTQKLMHLESSRAVALTVFGHDGEQWAALKRSPDFYD